MLIHIRCRQCDTVFEANPIDIGCHVTCPECGAGFVARESDRDDLRSRRDRDDRGSRSERSSRPARSSPSPRRRRRRTNRGPMIAAILVPTILLVGVGMFFLVRRAVKDKKGDGPETDVKWERVEVPGKFRAMMPGTPTRETTREGRIEYSVNLEGKYAFFVCYLDVSVGLRAGIRAEDIQNKMCNTLTDGDSVEIRRESIQLRGFAGKQSTFQSRDGKYWGVIRVYIANGWCYYLMVGGDKGLSPDDTKVKQFLDSFEILGTGDYRPNNPQPPAQLNPKYHEPDPSILAARPADALLRTPGSTVYLSDMSEFGGRPCAIGWSFTKNGNLGESFAPKRMVIINGRTPDHVLSMCPPLNDYTRVCYSLGKRARTFEGAVALSEYEASRNPQPTGFAVLGDGKLLWQSAYIRAQGESQKFSIDVGNVGILELRTFTESGFNHGSAAVWVDPLVRVK